MIDGRIVFVGGEHGGTTIAADPEVDLHHRARAGAGRRLARRQRLGDQRAGGLEARPDGEERLRLGVAVDPPSGARTQIAGDLAYPYGLLEDGGSVVVSESWRSALTRISPGAAGRNEPVLENLPAYPSRLSRGATTRIWLALFAPRSQLVEFVLSEDRYRRRMIDEIDADYWVAPCLRSGRSPLEPTQQGGVKQLGVLKPWSPSRSYGLVARLDRRLSSDRQPSQPGERAPARRHLLPRVRGTAFISPPKATELSPRCADEGSTS